MPPVSRYLLFNKPYQVLCQFSRDGTRKTLADFIPVPDVYAAGRLDFDSEGLVLLTNDGKLQHMLTDPRFGHSRTYFVQVEGTVDNQALERLSLGVIFGGERTLPCQAVKIDEPLLPERNPPIRFRRSIPTSWLSLTLREGRNRQVRHMTSTVGLPTLRLIRVAIGQLQLAHLPPGEWRNLTPAELKALRTP